MNTNGIIYGGTTCGGYKSCVGKTYMAHEVECQECAADAQKGLQQAETLTMEKKGPEPLKFLPIPDYGNHMTTKEFYKACMVGGICSSDGVGYYATKDQISNKEVDPDLFTSMLDHPFTHVVWFNK